MSTLCMLKKLRCWSESAFLELTRRGAGSGDKIECMYTHSYMYKSTVRYLTASLHTRRLQSEGNQTCRSQKRIKCAEDYQIIDSIAFESEQW